MLYHRSNTSLTVLFALVLTFTAILTPLAHATDVGLGLVLGQPTGLSGKLTTSRSHAIDAALAWDLSDDHDHFHFHSDYLWLRNAALHVDNVALDWYFGVGGRLLIYDEDHRRYHEDDYQIGVRFPIGLGYTFKNPRIEIFAELALIMNILESTSADIDGGIGARFHF